MKFSIKDFFCKCDQIRSYLQIWSHLLKKSLMGNFIFCAVKVASFQPSVSLQMEHFTCNFQGFCLLFRNTYAKKGILMAASTL